MPAHIDVFGISLHFYGAMYALAAVFGYFLATFLAKKKHLSLKKSDIADAVFYGMIGGVLGGRLFYVFFYNFSFFWANPLEIFAVWNGGMSIHGGMIGGAFALFLFSWFRRHSLLVFSDLFVPGVALGLALGRLGNFVNKELVGRPTDFFLGMDFGDGIMRHPSQLYAMGKDLFLFALLLFLAQKKRPRGLLTLVFFLGYAILRFFVEFFREPDPQIGLLWGILSFGQVLSLLLFALSLLLFLLFWKINQKNT